MRRIVWWLVVIDVVVLAVVLGVWLALRASGGSDERGNVVNAGLRGSRPPAGQRMPDLSGIEGIAPPVPSPRALRGSSVALVGTCMTCRSGDVYGGYLGRLEESDRPDGSRIVVIGWDGDAEVWRDSWRIAKDGGPAGIELHVATTEAAADEVRRALGVGARAGSEESGVVYLYDSRGRWRSTFFLGQLNRDDIRYDLEQLAG